MTDLAPYLERLGLEQYLDAFLSEGFDTWETLTDIQESDFDALNVKLGHRRKLQRAIADYRGIPYERLIGSPAQEPLSEAAKAAESGANPALAVERAPGLAPEAKRKYRRHPKPDENAPERPPSAYVIFSNKVREEVKDQNLSFTQIAKLVGDRWQKLDPGGKEPFEAQANAAKERYNIQLSTYRKTDAYKEYMQYLADFKSKHGQPAEPKRPKLEAESSGSIISTKSLELQPEAVPQASGHTRGGSVGSVASSSLTGGAMQSTPSVPVMPSRPPLPSSRSGSPPIPATREYFRPGLLSSHSSVSDESTTVRSELPEPVMRTAALSLGAGASVPPPLSAQTATASPTENMTTPDHLERSRIAYFLQQQNPPTPPFGPQGIMSAPAHLSPTMQEMTWRQQQRGSDPRAAYQEMPRTLHASLPYNTATHQFQHPSRLPMMSSDRPPDFSQGASMRTLPPPRPPSTTSQALSQLGSPSLGEEPPYFRRPVREDARPQLDRSESDAASTLAGLAAGVPRSDTAKPIKPPPPHTAP
ncbi:uncharacterized protein PV06_04154 [Exophiala oligosperma]|uniref:HMG box domain-containing protein n=2 Tax=Chaetothyriales TaxID=34395 RepID=A0A0D2AT59_9EURO|nr:uncharacterized protein PV06_04154 [Exophiala oligosperma]KAJ9619414.1 hypothetical protein H2204_012690 [Knufia peltigerae]KIW43001.1 hypothetical protein PV06_04154 [Exophiala oligosperma]